MLLDLQQDNDSPLERNSFGFAKLRDEELVDVTLDLTPHTDVFWQEKILPFFEIEVLQGHLRVRLVVLGIPRRVHMPSYCGALRKNY